MRKYLTVGKAHWQVDDIEAKLDQLIDMYMEDRKRLLALPPSVIPGAGPLPGSPDSCSSGPTGMPQTPSSLAVCWFTPRLVHV